MGRAARVPERLACSVLAVLVLIQPLAAQEAADQEKKKVWTNETDLSVVLTDGNSRAQTLGLTNLLQRKTEITRYRFKIDGLRSDTADDTFALVSSTGAFTDPATGLRYNVVKPDIELDVEKYLVDNNYEQKYTDRAYWTIALTWDRNKDAGILSRWVGFGGIGRAWFDREGLSLTTSIGYSYTSREEETPDPEKEDRFGGLRGLWSYKQDLGKVTTLSNNFTGNINVADTQDYSIDTTLAVEVRMTSHLHLKVSYQWLYNNEPALEDVDLVQIVFVGPPINQDVTIEIGEVDIRKEQSDSVLRTSLSIDF